MFDTEGIFVTVGGKSYRTTCGCYHYTPDEIGPTLEIETVIHPSYEVPNPKTSTLIANVNADIHLNTTPEIVDVIFKDPATIVFWSDNTKTVVKTQDGESYDPEKGMAMAFCKKLMGDNKRDYYHTFLHYLKKYNKQQAENAFSNYDKQFTQLRDDITKFDFSAAAKRLAESFKAINTHNGGDIR